MTHSLAESLGGGSPVAWATDWLNVAGFPATPENIAVVYSWEWAESGGGGGMWNPLNTTQPWPGATNANSVGVKNYLSRLDGLRANAHVIHNGFYPVVVARFTMGNNAPATRDAITASPWGTKVLPLIPVPNGPHPTPPGGTVQLVTALNASNHLELFALNADGHLTHTTQHAAGWSPWAPFPGPQLETVSLARNADGRLELFGYPPGGGVVHAYQGAPGGTWTAWAKLMG